MKGVSIESSLCQVINGQISVEVCNNTSSDIKLLKATKICNVEVFDSPIKVIDHVDDDNKIIGMIMNDKNICLSTERMQAYKDKIASVDFPEAHDKLSDLLNKFQDVIAIPGDTLGSTNVIKHNINLEPGTKAIYVPAYRIPQRHRTAVRESVDEMLKEGIVVPSNSPYNFPLLCVPKKDKTWRVVIDFRKLNDKTIPDRYPVPCMEDLISSIGSNKYFTSLDLLQGYLQINLTEESAPMTAFSTDRGHFHYVRMPFGLRTAPITFTRLINTVFHGMLGEDLLAYMDDLIVISNTLEDHFSKLERVFLRLREANLKVKLKKCEFVKSSIEYLGHKLSQKGVEITDTKITAVKQFPVPQNRKNLMQYLGVTGFYRKYIQDYARIAAPLTDLLRKDREFIWKNEQQEAFEKLKEKMSSPPILIFPNFNNEFYLATDASGIGIGGVLMQKLSNKLHPIAFYSRKFKDSEKKMSVTDREATAVVNSLVHFKYIILGHRITVLTDHLPLLQLFNNPGHSPKRTRMFITIQDFHPTFRYIQGKFNTLADAFSRNIPEMELVDPQMFSILQLNSDFLINWDTDVLKDEQKKDEKLGKVMKYLSNPEGNKKPRFPVPNIELVDGLLVRRVNIKTRSLSNNVTQAIVPKSLINTALSIVHDNNYFAHPGAERTYHQARQFLYWKNMESDIKQYIKNCKKCHEYKGKVPSPEKVLSYPVPNKPFERVHIDLLTNFSESNRSHKHLLVIVDALTRYSVLIPLRTKTGDECASQFYNEFICRYGLPEQIITDSGREFNNSFYAQLCKIYSIKKVNTAIYHPSSNGVVERLNRKILEILRSTIGGTDTNWDVNLNAVQLTLNTSYHSSIKESPHTALFGVPARSPFDISIPTHDRTDDYVTSLMKNAHLRFECLQQKLIESDIIQKKHKNTKAKENIVNVGDTVYMKKNVRNELNYKLGRKFQGPYKVLEKIGINKFKLQSCSNEEVTKPVHVSQIKVTIPVQQEKRVKKVRFNIPLDDSEDNKSDT